MSLACRRDLLPRHHHLGNTVGQSQSRKTEHKRHIDSIEKSLNPPYCLQACSIDPLVMSAPSQDPPPPPSNGNEPEKPSDTPSQPAAETESESAPLLSGDGEQPTNGDVAMENDGPKEVEDTFEDVPETVVTVSTLYDISRAG